MPCALDERPNATQKLTSPLQTTLPPIHKSPGRIGNLRKMQIFYDIMRINNDYNFFF